MIRYDPPVPRVGFGIAALIMSVTTFSVMVVLPAALEQDTSVLAVRTDMHRTAAAARAASAMSLRCTVPPAVNAPLFSTTRATESDPECKQPS